MNQIWTIDYKEKNNSKINKKKILTTSPQTPVNTMHGCMHAVTYHHSRSAALSPKTGHILFWFFHNFFSQSYYAYRTCSYRAWLCTFSTHDLVFIGWEKYTIEPLNKYQQGHVWHWDACLFLVGYDHVTLGKKMIQLTHALGENISHTVVRSYIKSCAACHFFLTDPWHEQRWEKKQIIKHCIFDHVIMRMTGRSATLVTMTM